MPECPAPPSLSVVNIFTADPLRVVIVGSITSVLLGLGVVATYQAFASAAHPRRATALGLGAASMLAFAIALFVDSVILDDYVAAVEQWLAREQWLAASMTPASSTCFAVVPAQFARIHAVEMSLRTVDYTAGFVFVACFIAMLVVDRAW